jgi:hypothetical protein
MFNLCLYLSVCQVSKKSKIQLILHETDLLFSILKPSFDMALFQYFWRFAQICKKFAAFPRKIIFVIVSVVKLFRNNNKNNFVSKFYKFPANLCKSSEILEQCHVKRWLNYRINGSVSYSFSCNKNERSSCSPSLHTPNHSLIIWA